MKLVSTVLIMGLITGCATGPKVSYNPEPGHRIGILNMVEKNFTHSHVGTTAFNNKVHSHEYSQLNVHEYINEIVIDRLRKRGLEAILVDLEDWPNFDGSSLVRMGWNDYGIRQQHMDEIQRLMIQHRLSLLLTFESFRLQDHIGGSSVHIGGYGLYTRSFFGASTSHAYANVWGYGIRSNPVAYVGSGGSGSTRELEFKELNDSTIRDLEVAIQPIIDEIVVNTLTNLGID